MKLKILLIAGMIAAMAGPLVADDGTTVTEESSFRELIQAKRQENKQWNQDHKARLQEAIEACKSGGLSREQCNDQSLNTLRQEAKNHRQEQQQSRRDFLAERKGRQQEYRDGHANPDRREDFLDRREDVRDRKEDRWDKREDVGDRREDRRDHREDYRDRAEDRWDRNHGPSRNSGNQGSYRQNQQGPPSWAASRSGNNGNGNRLYGHRY